MCPGVVSANIELGTTRCGESAELEVTDQQCKVEHTKARGVGSKKYLKLKQTCHFQISPAISRRKLTSLDKNLNCGMSGFIFKFFFLNCAWLVSAAYWKFNRNRKHYCLLLLENHNHITSLLHQYGEIKCN